MTAALRHEALPFTGPDGFVKATVDLFDDALERGAVPVLLHVSQRADAVRSELGDRGAQVCVVDMGVDGRNPARLLPALQRLVDEHPGRSLHVMAEPVRAGVDNALLGEIVLHECLLHLPEFSGWPCAFTCGYDIDALDAERAAEVEHRHRRPPADPADHVARLRAEALPTRPSDCEELGVDRTTLGALRGFIQGRASDSGLAPDRADDLVYAVNEVVTNSLCHGEGRARVSVWHRNDAVVCEVRDRGWIRDPLAGRVAPDPNRSSGRGLWLVNQLCDLVQLRSSPAGTTVRMFIDAPAG